MRSEVQIPLATAETMPCTECGRTFSLQRVPPFTPVFCSACGKEQSAAGQLGAYLVLGLLGKGGMGAVFRGIDPALDRPVAIKVLTEDAATGPAALEQFRREAKAAAQINHINVARIFAFGIEQGKPYIVMEFVKGRSLLDLIEEKGHLDVPFTLHIGVQAAEGLAAAAANDLVHGDVKPENILVDDEGSAKLIDFGLASLANQPGSREIWGTPYYISPERLKPGQQIDFRSDLYSLGGTLYHALTGRPPFEGETAVEVAKARLSTVPKSPSELRPSVDPAVSSIVMRALQREPGARYPSYTSMIGDMQRVSALLGGYSRRKKRSGFIVSSRQTSSILLPKPESQKRSPLAPLLIAGIALLAVGGAALFFLGKQPPPPERNTPVSPPEPMVLDPVAVTASSNERPPSARPGSSPGDVTQPGAGSQQLGNIPLFAFRDEATVEPGSTVLIDVLANDSRPDAIAPEIVETTVPSHGKASVTSSGKVSYRPNDGFEGKDTFDYTIRHSSGKTARAMVTVTVAPKPPPAPAPTPPRPAVATPAKPPAAGPNPPTNELAAAAPAAPAAAAPTAPEEPKFTSDPVRATFSPDDMVAYAPGRGGGVKGSSIMIDGGRKIWIKGHVWQALPIRYLVTTNTVLEFTVSLKKAGDIHSVGLDTQYKQMSEDKLLQLAGGAQTRSNRDYFTARNPPFEYTYRIPIGRYGTGPRSYLVIGTSDSGQNSDICFSDVAIHEFTNTTVAAQKPGMTYIVKQAGKKDVLKAGAMNTLEFDAGTGNLLDSGQQDHLEIEFKGLLSIAQAGKYKFQLSADDSVELLIDGKSVGKATVGNDVTTGEIQLTAGNHPMVVNYREETGAARLRIKWIPPGRKAPETIPANAILQPAR